MAEKIWTAAELEKMTPAERREISRAAVVTDLSMVDPELLERARASARRHMEATRKLQNGAAQPPHGVDNGQ